MRWLRRVLEPLRRSPWLAYLVLLIAAFVITLGRHPIRYIDADVWIHLAGGRYLFQHGAIPFDSYFSFLQPPRPWVSYAWLFQALMYAVYSWAGYLGLVLLRTASYGLLILLVCRLLLGGPKPPSRFGWRLWIVIVSMMLLLPNHLNVRPYLVTYVLIVAFLLILERAPHRTRWLPVLGVLWCNLHGVAFPIMWLICGAYTAEYLIDRLRGTRTSSLRGRADFLSVLLTVLSVLVTPVGPRLFAATFRPTIYLQQVVTEYAPVDPKHLLSLTIEGLMPGAYAPFMLCVLSIALALCAAVGARRLRVSHGLLVFGGLVLLWKMSRLENEFLLLSLPLLQAHDPGLFQWDKRRASPWATAALSVLFMLLPFGFLAKSRLHLARYPFSHSLLPEGVVTVLGKLGTRGKVLADLTASGYIRWRLPPGYTVFADMDSYFTDEDFYRATYAFVYPHVLQGIVEEYDPSFLSVPIQQYAGMFHDIAGQFPDYVPIFLDDVALLFVNQRHYPELAQRYRLTVLPSMEVIKQDPEQLVAGLSDPAPLTRELHQLLAMYPESGLANRLMALILARQGDLDQAVQHAQIVIDQFPESPSGYILKGDLLARTGQVREAAACYLRARSRMDDRAKQQEMTRRLGRAYLAQSRYVNAFWSLSHSVDPLSPLTPLDDLYALAMATLHTGRVPAAAALLQSMLERVPDGDTEWRNTIERAMASLPAGAHRL